MKNYIIIKNFISSEECDNILNKCKKNLKLSDGIIGTRDVAFKSVRKSSTGFVKNILEIDDRIREVVNDHVHLKGYDCTQFEYYQFTEYKEGEYYHWHTDSAPNTLFSNRLCSMVIQLNDEYDGGNLELKIEENEIELERGKGNLYLFYSNITHRVTPIIKGTRYSLVNWIAPEKNNNYKKTLL